MQSETIGALAAALAKAQGEISPAMKDRTAKITQTAGYEYATLTSLWESARAALSKNGLAVTQVTNFDANGEIVLLTTLLHSSGEWIGGVYPIRTADQKPQTLGSALTYARRYAFGALVGLTSDDDDDGNGAQNGTNGGAQHTTKPTAQAVPNGTTTGKATANGSSPAKGAKVPTETNAMKAFHARGAELFGADWGTARGWLIERYTAKETPANVRHSSKDLTDMELNALRSNMEEYTKGIVKAWQARRAELDAISIATVDEVDYLGQTAGHEAVPA